MGGWPHNAGMLPDPGQRGKIRIVTPNLAKFIQLLDGKPDVDA